MCISDSAGTVESTRDSSRGDRGAHVPSRRPNGVRGPAPRAGNVGGGWYRGGNGLLRPLHRRFLPSTVSDLFHGFVPLGVEAGFRFTPDVYAGLVFQYAIGLWNGCPSNMSCSGHDVGLGFDVRYHPLPGRQVDPWFGIGAGYEWISFAQSQPGFSSDTGLNGFELLHLDVGADLVASPNLRVGSFLEFKLGRYRNLDAASGGPSTSTGITNKALHEFLTLGFRFSFLP